MPQGPCCHDSLHSQLAIASTVSSTAAKEWSTTAITNRPFHVGIYLVCSRIVDPQILLPSTTIYVFGFQCPRCWMVHWAPWLTIPWAILLLGALWVTCQCPASPKKRRFGLMLGGTSFKHVQTCHHIISYIWYYNGGSKLVASPIQVSFVNKQSPSHPGLAQQVLSPASVVARPQCLPLAPNEPWLRSHFKQWPARDLKNLHRICIPPHEWRPVSPSNWFWVRATLYALFKDLPRVTMRRSWDGNEAHMLQGPWWGHPPNEASRTVLWQPLACHNHRKWAAYGGWQRKNHEKLTTAQCRAKTQEKWHNL